MTQQDPFKQVQSWTNKYLVVSGKPCRLTDNSTSKTLFQCDTGSASEVLDAGYSFLRCGRIA
jgi:hypothetical protein